VWTTGALLLGVALLVGCSDHEDTQAPTPKPTAAAPAKPTVTQPPGTPSAADLVLAVPANKAANVPVQVKFALEGRPDVAQPVTLDLMIEPTGVGVDRVSGTVQVDDGLELIEGAQIPPADKPTKDTPITHQIKLRPKRDGIFMVNAIVNVDSGRESSSGTFVIPIIAGAGLPDLAPKPEAAPSREASADTPGSPPAAAAH